MSKILVTGSRGTLGRRLVEDERTFIDLARSPVLVADEHPIVG